MLRFLLLFIVFILPVFSQDIPNLPLKLGAGSAEVYNNKIYYFGGSNSWSGNIVYDSVYVFDGNNWALENTIPDKNLWDVETVRVGNEVYLISGWPSGANRLRKYNLDTKQWTYLANSPNVSYTWGVTAEYWNGNIYLITPNGSTYQYSIQNDQWTTKTNAGVTGPLNLSSILYQNEIYVIGFNDSAFVKYNPVTDQWTPLAKSSYQVGASAMGIINNLIYCVGGNSTGNSIAEYRSILVYDANLNQWALDSLEIKGKRHWMATAEYQGGLYVLGGIDSTALSVDIVEEIVPQGTAVSALDNDPLLANSFELKQNYPNPFNPSTTITYQLDKTGNVSLEVYDILGKRVATLLDNKTFTAGSHSIRFNARDLVSGVYFYRLILNQNGVPAKELTRKMILMK